MSLRTIVPQLLAGLLAIGGTCWGVLLSPWILDAGQRILPLLVFGPGYLVTLGYYVRAFALPPLRACQCVWWLSILVQGGWLTWHLFGTLSQGGLPLGLTEPHVPVEWWFLATASSVVGLVMETGDNAGSNRLDDPGRCASGGPNRSRPTRDLRDRG